MKTNIVLFRALLLGLFWSLPFTVFSATNVFENFDGPEWPTVTGNPPSQTSASNFAVNAWTVTRGIGGTGQIATSGTNYFWLFRNTTNVTSSLSSPMLTNGIGTVTFDYRNSTAGTNFNILIKTYNGTSWTTNDVITNAAATYTGYTKALNLTNAQQLMIERCDTLGGQTAIDTILITTPPPVVTLSNLTNNPALPTDQDEVSISANVSIQSIADTFVMTNYWREWPSTNWVNKIAMTSNAPNLYMSVSNIPAKAIGTLVEYYAQATYSSIGNATNTTSTSNKTYLVQSKSSYTNLAVIGQLSAPLRNVASYLWQGVIQVTNANPTFQFQGISNGVPTIWGDVNQTVTTVPLAGQAEVTSTNITLYTTNAGYYVFTFNETNREYNVLSCTYENFNTWTNADNFTPPHTNADNWILFSANTSNDATRTFSGAGRSAIVETNGWLQTPYLSNGVGQISFWYRNWPTNGAPTGKFQVQISADPTNWSAPASVIVSNIVSTNYLFFSTRANDYSSKYVRIQNTQTAATARLCFDEVVIAQAGAGVSGVSVTPTNVTILDPVTLAIDLTPYNGAVISNVTAWYRFDTNSAWTTASMFTTNGIRYFLTDQLTGLPVGTLYYVIQCDFSGVQSDSPRFFPGTNAPSRIDIALPSDSRYEPFDDPQWPTITGNNPSTSTASNFVVNAWTVTRGIGGTGQIATSSTNYLWLFRNNTNLASSLLSPLLTNGIGSVTFAYRNSTAGTNFNILIKTYNGTSWTTNDIITNALATYTYYTNALFLTNALQLMIERLDNLAGATAIDTIRITYPPANVIVTNVYINPGYPVAGQAFTASCDVVSINPIFPAYNITPYFYYGTNFVRMTQSGGSGTTNHYVALVSLGSVGRDTLFIDYVRSLFDGYCGSASESQSPKTSSTNSFIARAYSSSYTNIAATVDGSNTLGRLLTNGLWQSIVNTTSSSNFSLAGLGYSAGAGYSTNAQLFGNSNNWQSTIPLADVATTGQPPISINLPNGQFVVRFDETTGNYLVQRCVWQDFDKDGEGDLYKQSTLSGKTSGGAGQSFDLWPTNTTLSRSINFEGTPWTDYLASNYVSGVNDGSGFVIYSGKVVNVGGAENIIMQTASNITGKSDSFIALGSHWGYDEGKAPLKGIGRISYNYAATRTNVPAEIAVYLADTSIYDPPTVGTSVTYYTTFKDQDGWRNSTPVSSTTNIVNTTYTNIVADVNTNVTYDVIFSQISGTQNLRFASVSVAEWYAEAMQTNSDGWIGSEYWIESSLNTNQANVCRLDVTRANNPTNQFLRSPRIDGGIKYIEFFYSGVPSLSQNPPTNIAVNFKVELTDNPAVWTNTLDTISTNFINNTAGTNYYRYYRSLQTSQGGLYVRIKNTTPKPGALLLDGITIPGYATTNDWYVNNMAIDYKEQKFPPWPRQYFRGAGYLNNTRAGSSLATGTEAPDTNTFPQIRTPFLSGGIGEISFRYRNWATTAPVIPGKLVIQAAQMLTSPTNESDWTTTIATINNIINTNDYLYFSTSVYDTTNRYVRIYSDDTYTNTVGRICLDDVLVTAPLASTLVLTNLVITPSIPLYTNTVDISVDVYRLFYNPAISGLTGYYGSASSYTGLASVGMTALPMTCVATNTSAGGRMYSYKTKASTPIPALPSDTFVKYSAQASFSGFHSEVTSPSINQTFATYPHWLAPLDKLNGTNQAFYVVLSCPTGSVWVNEINVRDITDWLYGSPTPKYVEVCGQANVNLNGWAIQLLTTDGATQSIYVVTNSMILPDSTNGFGFFLLGDTNTIGRNMTLTNALPEEGGLRLIRKSGIYADALAFAYNPASVSPLTGLGFTYAGDDDLLSDWSLSLTGTGQLVNAFSWVNTANWSYGTVNPEQLLQGISQGLNIPTNVTIVAFMINATNIWLECSGGTNGWGASPWYSTNLINTNGWVLKTPFTSTLTPSNTYQLNFSRTNLTPCFYRVVVTNGL